MTVMLERPQAPPAPVRSSWGAWVAIALSPVMYVVAIWMAFFVLGDEDIKWWGNLIVVLLLAAPPVTAIVLGARSARSGNRLGAHATALSVAWVSFVTAFWYAANYPYNGESLVMPTIWGILAAILLGAAVEGWDRLSNHRERHLPVGGKAGRILSDR
jgi:peptidoglycan/LPS O-acetylase OafA/YrhL